jgi:hypothetical protein
MQPGFKSNFPIQIMGSNILSIVGLTSELLIHSTVISPHYGGKTVDGTPAGQNEGQYKKTHARNERQHEIQPG